MYLSSFQSYQSSGLNCPCHSKRCIKHIRVTEVCTQTCWYICQTTYKYPWGIYYTLSSTCWECTSILRLKTRGQPWSYLANQKSCFIVQASGPLVKAKWAIMAACNPSTCVSWHYNWCTSIKVFLCPIPLNVGKGCEEFIENLPFLFIGNTVYRGNINIICFLYINKQVINYYRLSCLPQ